MTELRPSAVALAAAVVAAEMRSRGEGDVGQRVMAKLSGGLRTLIGSNGFDVLVLRASRRAQQAEPSLPHLHLPGPAAGGRMEFAANPPDVERQVVTLLSHLFELLARFIGEDLVLRVVRDAWPTANDVEVPKETKT